MGNNKDRIKRYQFTEAERLLLEQIPMPLAVFQLVDGQMAMLAVSDGLCELFGFADREEAHRVMAENLLKILHPDDMGRIREALIRFCKEGGVYEVICRAMKYRESAYHIIHATGKHVVMKSGVRLAFVGFTDEGIYSEETETQGTNLSKSLNSALHEESFLKASYYDVLTGLPSMTHFFKLVEKERKRLLEEEEEPALLYMDLIGMKFYNTRYGFTEGDKALKAFGELLAGTFGLENCSHFGAGHFVAVTKREKLEDTLERLFEKCLTLDRRDEFHLRVGIYENKIQTVPASAACDRAKLACDGLKSSYTSCYRFYSPEMREAVVRSRYLVDNLDKAIREKWIQVYYQPIVRAINGRVSDDEALSRWVDPVYGFLSPAEFIPVLENAGVIYKLDLYVLEQVLEKIKVQEKAGLHIVPQSINLSRSDFATCDIVEEFRRRVDEANVSRDKITIEITESTVGQDFEFMKEQISRFQKLGFPVWMDDFGSGYSSLDFLQNIKFDLIKFDMSLIRRLDKEGESGIILTELVKMAAALGINTVCEGVETEEQVKFLQDIGCSKLQGYYYSKPVPFPMDLQWHAGCSQFDYENPAEADYYETIGRVNLYDMDIIANEDEKDLHNVFNTLPMGIIEVNGDSTRFVRSNQSYRDFVKRFFGMDLSYEGTAFAKYSASFMYNIVRTCCELGARAFYDEKMPDGSVVHSFARRIGINPVNGNIAVAIVVLSIKDVSEGATYADIARALAADYYYLYYVDLKTDDFIEYSSMAGKEELAMERHGKEFFASVKKDAEKRIYEEDRAFFLNDFTKENILRKLEEDGVFTKKYRLIDTGKPMYVNLKITRMNTDGRHLIIGISTIN